MQIENTFPWQKYSKKKKIVTDQMETNSAPTLPDKQGPVLSESDRRQQMIDSIAKGTFATNENLDDIYGKSNAHAVSPSKILDESTDYYDKIINSMKQGQMEDQYMKGINQIMGRLDQINTLASRGGDGYFSGQNWIAPMSMKDIEEENKALATTLTGASRAFEPRYGLIAKEKELASEVPLKIAQAGAEERKFLADILGMPAETDYKKALSEESRARTENLLTKNEKPTIGELMTMATLEESDEDTGKVLKRFDRNIFNEYMKFFGYEGQLPTNTGKVKPTLDAFLKEVKTRGSKLSDEKLKQYYIEKYGE